MKRQASTKTFLHAPIIVFFGIMILFKGPSVLAGVANNLALLGIQREWSQVYLTASRGECVRAINKSPVHPIIGQVLKALPGSNQGFINAGREAYLLGDCDEARRNWLNALATESEDPFTAFWLFWLSGADVSTLPDILPAAQLAQVVWNFGRQAEVANATESAFDWYELSFELYPSSSAVDSMLRLKEPLGIDLDEVKMWDRIVVSRSSSEADYWWALGQVAETRQDWQMAADAFEQGGRLALSPYTYLLHQGAALEKIGQSQSAEAVYLRAAESRPELFDAHYRLGLLYYDRKDYRAAIPWLQKALTILPDQFSVNYRLGLSYYELGEHPKAAQSLEVALLSRPDDVLTNYYLAQSLYLNGQVSSAISYLAIAVGLDAGKPWQWAAQLGDWQVEDNDHAGALATYQRALEWSQGAEEIQDRIDRLLAQ